MLGISAASILSTAVPMIRKHIPQIVAGIAIIVFLCIGIAAIYDAGKDAGIAISNDKWHEKDKKRLKEDDRNRRVLAKELGKAMHRVAEENEKNQQTTMRLIDEKDNQIKRLNSDLGSKRMRFSVERAACNENTVRGQANSSGIDGEPTDQPRIRITGADGGEIYATEEQINSMIWTLHEEKERLKIYFKAAAGELRSLVRISGEGEDDTQVK